MLARAFAPILRSRRRAFWVVNNTIEFGANAAFEKGKPLPKPAKAA